MTSLKNLFEGTSTMPAKLTEEQIEERAAAEGITPAQWKARRETRRKSQKKWRTRKAAERKSTLAVNKRLEDYVDIKEKIDHEKLEKLKKENEQLDLKLQEERGSLMRKDVVEEAFQARLAKLSSSLDALPARLKTRLPDLSADDLDQIRDELAILRSEGW